MFDVGDTASNATLTVCFFGIALLTLASMMPWRRFGFARSNRLTRWIFVPVILLAIVYESAMPARFDIRIDLFLLLPMYVLVLVL